MYEKIRDDGKSKDFLQFLQCIMASCGGGRFNQEENSACIIPLLNIYRPISVVDFK